MDDGGVCRVSALKSITMHMCASIHECAHGYVYMLQGISGASLSEALSMEEETVLHCLSLVESSVHVFPGGLLLTVFTYVQSLVVFNSV